MGLHLVQLCLLSDLCNQDKTIGTLRSNEDDGSENATKSKLVLFYSNSLSLLNLGDFP